MQGLHTAILALLPARRKTTPSGWTGFNAPCCHHRGHSTDTRQRGGILLTPEGGFTFHCFNCNFKAGWSPGKLLSQNTRSLFSWLGMSPQEIQKINLAAMKQQSTEKPLPGQNFELEERTLPGNARPLDQWPESEVASIKQYVLDRGLGLDWYPWHWTDEKGYADRVLIPFYHLGKIVGYTARKITSGKPKYLTHSQPGYVFNMDRQVEDYDRQYVIVVEGQMDAIAIDGVAIMSNDVNSTQAARISALNRQVIVVPDRDRAGAKLLTAALTHEWSMSLPPWGDNIKDAADAVKQYGRLYVLTTILHYRETNKIKIQLMKRQLERLDD